MLDEGDRLHGPPSPKGLKRRSRAFDAITNGAAWNAIWNNDAPTRWSAFTRYVNMVRSAWPFLAAVVFVLLIALATSQGREALKYSGSLNYPGGPFRAVCTGLALFLFSAAIHEATLRSINVHYPFTSRALESLTSRFNFALMLSLAVPLGLTLFYLHNWIGYGQAEETPLREVRTILLVVGGVSFFFSAAYDFTAPAWRRNPASSGLARAERWFVGYLKVLFWLVFFAYTFSLIIGPILMAVYRLFAGVPLDFGASSFSGFLSALIALVVAAFWNVFSVLTPSLKRYYSNTNQFFVFRTWRGGLASMITVLFVVFLVALAIWPGKVAGAVGPVATLLAAVLAIAGFFGQLAYMNARRQSIPALLVVLALSVLSGALGRSNYHNIRVQDRDPQVGRQNLEVMALDVAVERWIKAHPDNQKPAIVVLAEGGGIRAALHAAAILSCLDSREPDFYGNIFAMSGVSGGSVGLGAYLSARNAPLTGAEGELDTECDFAFDASSPVAPGRGTLPQVTTSFLQSDFFSPLLAGFMLRDLPMNVTWCTLTSVVGGLCDLDIDRANVFESSFRNGFRDVIIDSLPHARGAQARAAVADQLRGQPALGFLEAVAGVSGEGGAQPILVFNTFDVRSGQPAIVSNVRYHEAPLASDLGDGIPGWATAEPYWNALDVIEAEGSATAYLDVASAAHMSARFPLISPPGRLCPGNEDCDLRGAGPFIDGGYFDNSGAAGIQPAVAALRRLAPEKPVVVLHIIYRGLPGEPRQARLPAFFDLGVPVNGVLQARGAHGQVPIEQLCRTIEGDLDGAGESVCGGVNAFLREAPQSEEECFAVSLPGTPAHFRWLRSPLQARYGDICDGGDLVDKEVYMAANVVLPLGWLLGDAGETILRRVDHQIPALRAGLCPAGEAPCWLEAAGDTADVTLTTGDALPE